jgi:hypothetical protein
MRKENGIPRPVVSPLALVRDMPLVPRSVLRAGTRRRLENQLTRAFQQSFGAEQGLRVVVRLATLEMQRSGASPKAIRRELTDVVAAHPNATTGTAPGTESRVTSLTAMIVRWSERALQPA